MSLPTLSLLTQTLAQSATTINAYEDRVVDLVLQHKRRRLVDSLSARLDQQVEQRIATASMLHDHQLTWAAGEIVNIAKGISRRMEAERWKNAGGGARSGARSGANVGVANSARSYSTMTTSFDARATLSMQVKTKTSMGAGQGMSIDSTKRAYSTRSMISSSALLFPSCVSSLAPSPTRKPPTAFPARFRSQYTTKAKPQPRPQPEIRTKPPRSNSTSPTQSKPSSSKPLRPPHQQPTLHATNTTTAPSEPVAPRRLTEMSYDELRKDSRFRASSRQWTALMVGIPLAVMLTWVFYKKIRVSIEERKKQMRSMADGGGSKTTTTGAGAGAGANANIVREKGSKS